MSDFTSRDKGAPMPTTKRRVDSDGPDFYPTPAWATQALLDVELFVGETEEPACGEGHMSEEIKRRGYRVWSYDKFDRGYGEVADFLNSCGPIENIVTNPPYNEAEAFLHKAMERATQKICLLLRLAFLEGAGRYETIYSVIPPSRVWVFSERVTMYPNGEVTAGNGSIAYAWFVWDKEDTSGRTEIKHIPPGAKPNGRKAKANG